MYKRLVKYSGETCLYIGRRIAAWLVVDPKLAEASAKMSSVQTAFEAQFTTWSDAKQAVLTTFTARTQAVTDLEGTIREFAVTLLALARNNHESVRYLSYFPDGYGAATRLVPPEQLGFVATVLKMLEGESEPKLLAFRPALEASRDVVVNAYQAYQDAAGTLETAWQMLSGERRLWAQGVESARALARSARPDDSAYIRRIFSAAAPPRRKARSEEEETPAVPDTPEELPAGGPLPGTLVPPDGSVPPAGTGPPEDPGPATTLPPPA